MLPQSGFAVDAVENGLESLELFEGRFAHEAQYTVRRMLGGYFQASRHMFRYQLFCISLCRFFQFIVFVMVKQKIIANTAADMHEGRLHWAHSSALRPCMPYILADGPPRSDR